jgi:hypothetical protein
MRTSIDVETGAWRVVSGTRRLRSCLRHPLTSLPLCKLYALPTINSTRPSEQTRLWHQLNEDEDSAPFQTNYSPEKGRVYSSAPQRPQVVNWRIA